jgi:release factor glutamine methyltransferase
MVAATRPLHQTLAAARERLLASGGRPEEAAVDVDLFTRTILGWDRAQVIVGLSSPTPDGLEPQLSEWLDRRVLREPTAYIVCAREFWGLEFQVTPDVLIPRPETELVVEEAVRLVNGSDDADAQRWRIADIGTGCGCIAVSLAHDVPGCTMVATDVSSAALTVAAENARRHGVADRIAFVTTSYLAGVDGTFDLITANPPYVRSGDWTALARDVRHEPHVAIIGGDSGLRDIAGVLDAASASLRSRGWLIMEFGLGQENDVRQLAHTRTQLQLLYIREDLQGIQRTAVFQRT